MNVNCLFHSCQGESHKLTDKPCQDASNAEVTDDMALAVVCDGHGGERYFRSNIGSELAVEITKKSIKQFVANMQESSYTPNGKKSIFDGIEFGAYGPDGEDNIIKHQKVHQALQWLFSSIISQWNVAINAHAFNTPLSKWEKEHVNQKYLDEFTSKIESKDNTVSFEKTYGCTLMAYVQTPRYWFAFHIGDGKCIMIHKTDNELLCHQPIPWDERCFLNKTTSMCDSKAIEEFRYCFQGNGEFPIAVFLGSDGMDDSYGDGENLTNFYINLLKEIIRNGKANTKKELAESLPIISARGSKDDMSVACIYKSKRPESYLPFLIEWQKEHIESQRNSMGEKIQKLQATLAQYQDKEKLSDDEKIKMKYASMDLEKALTSERQMCDKYKATDAEFGKAKANLSKKRR